MAALCNNSACIDTPCTPPGALPFGDTMGMTLEWQDMVEASKARRCAAQACVVDMPGKETQRSAPHSKPVVGAEAKVLLTKKQFTAPGFVVYQTLDNKKLSKLLKHFVAANLHDDWPTCVHLTPSVRDGIDPRSPHPLTPATADGAGHNAIYFAGLTMTTTAAYVAKHPEHSKLAWAAMASYIISFAASVFRMALLRDNRTNQLVFAQPADHEAYTIGSCTKTLDGSMFTNKDAVEALAELLVHVSSKPICTRIPQIFALYQGAMAQQHQAARGLADGTGAPLYPAVIVQVARLAVTYKLWTGLEQEEQDDDANKGGNGDVKCMVQDAAGNMMPMADVPEDLMNLLGHLAIFPSPFAPGVETPVSDNGNYFRVARVEQHRFTGADRKQYTRYYLNMMQAIRMSPEGRAMAALRTVVQKKDGDPRHHVHALVQAGVSHLLASVGETGYGIPRLPGRPARLSPAAVLLRGARNDDETRVAHGTLHMLRNDQEALRQLAYRMQRGEALVLLVLSPADLPTAAMLETIIRGAVALLACFRVDPQSFLARSCRILSRVLVSSIPPKAVRPNMADGTVVLAQGARMVKVNFGQEVAVVGRDGFVYSDYPVASVRRDVVDKLVGPGLSALQKMTRPGKQLLAHASTVASVKLAKALGVQHVVISLTDVMLKPVPSEQEGIEALKTLFVPASSKLLTMMDLMTERTVTVVLPSFPAPVTMKWFCAVHTYLATRLGFMYHSSLDSRGNSRLSMHGEAEMLFPARLRVAVPITLAAQWAVCATSILGALNQFLPPDQWVDVGVVCAYGNGTVGVRSIKTSADVPPAFLWMTMGEETTADPAVDYHRRDGTEEKYAAECRNAVWGNPDKPFPHTVPSRAFNILRLKMINNNFHSANTIQGVLNTAAFMRKWIACMFNLIQAMAKEVLKLPDSHINTMIQDAVRRVPLMKHAWGASGMHFSEGHPPVPPVMCRSAMKLQAAMMVVATLQRKGSTGLAMECLAQTIAWATYTKLDPKPLAKKIQEAGLNSRAVSFVEGLGVEFSLVDAVSTSPRSLRCGVWATRMTGTELTLLSSVGSVQEVVVPVRQYVEAVAAMAMVHNTGPCTGAGAGAGGAERCNRAMPIRLKSSSTQS